MKKTLLLPACLVATTISVSAQEKNAPPPPPPPPKIEVVRFTPPKIVKNKEVQEFYSRNPTVERVSWKSSDKITVTLRDKKKEVYDLTKPSDQDAFKAKYGELPGPPPPPPAPPTPPMPPKEKKVS